LDTINYFKNKNSGLIYLTTTDNDQKEAIVNLHYNIHEIIKSDNPNRQNNSEYIPHVTLLKEVPLNQLDEIQEIFLEEIDPIKINISEILIREKYDKNEWGEFRRFNLGGNATFSYPG
jgi:2'-5' RNA ligase